MNLLLLAHHAGNLEPMDYPILAAMFGIGAWLGWDVITRLITAKPRVIDHDGDTEM